MNLKKYFCTAKLAMQARTNGGILYLLPDMVLKAVSLVPLMFLWKVLAQSGYDAGMGQQQLMTYTYVNALLADMMIVRSYISAWNYDSLCIELFMRPYPVFGQVISRTAGEWVPSLLFFTLPMALAAPLFGIELMPKTLWVIPALVLCISLGFAFEFLFFCVTVRFRNVSWLTNVIRTAIAAFFSGTVIPFRILPFGMERWMAYQPFAGLGGAVLSLYVGSAGARQVIPMQIVWNAVIWAAAVICFNRSRERMVSFGG